ncbi:MAG: hypothetical protein ABH886_10725 [Candidatus Desantisbacteria bacterium]
MKKVVIILLSCIILVGIVYGIKMLFVPHLPELVVNSPVDGFVADKYSVEITGKVSLDCVVKAVVIKNNKEISVAFAKPSPSNGEYQTTLCLSNSFRDNELLADGTYTIKVSALNVAKKVTVVERYIVLSSLPPEQIEMVEDVAGEEAREQAEMEAQEQAEAQARLDAQKQATEDARKQAEIATAQKWARVAQQAKLETQKRAEAQAKLDAQKQAAKDAQKQAELMAAQERARAAQQAKLDARKRAEAQAKLDAQEQAAEDAARKQTGIATAQERAKAAQQAKLDAQKRAEAQAKLDAQEQAAKDAQKQAEIVAAQERARAAQQAKLDAQKQAEAQAKLDAQKQAAEDARKQAEIATAQEQARAAQQAKLEAQKRIDAQAKLDAQEQAAKAAPKIESKTESVTKELAFKTGLELRQSGKIKEAIDAFSKVESDDSDYHKALWNISIMSLSVDQYSRTLKGIEEIARSSGETAFTCFYRGVAHYKMARKRASSENADEAISIYQQAIRDLDNAYTKRQDFSRIKIPQVPFNSPQKNVHDIRYYKAMCYYLIYKWDKTQGELEDAGLQKVKMQAKDAFDDYFRYFTNLPEEEKQACTALYNNAMQVNKEL